MENELLKTLNQLQACQNFAIGNDLVFIPGFKASLTDLFKNKVYTAAEMAYCDAFDDSLQRYASTWAAKEAVYKALKQLDSSPVGWKTLEIVREKTAGRPLVIIHSNPEKYSISLTIAHDGDYAWAIALMQPKNKPA